MKPTLTAAVICACLATAPGLAQHRADSPGAPQHLDGRHGLNHAYTDRGAEVHELPHGALSVPHGQDQYWFHHGQWYRHDGPHYVVVGPPLGAFVPVLPPLFVTVMVGGRAYYYANDAYYTYNADVAGYEVVAPPEGVEAGVAGPPIEPTPAPAVAEPAQFVYPQRGQSAEQQATDRYECHRWAAEQTGFDPTLTTGGVAPELAEAKRAEYARAMNACLEGRGYTVR